MTVAADTAPAEGNHPDPSGLTFTPAPPDMPIPDRLNIVLTAAVFSAMVGLLWLGSRVEAWYAIALVGVLFSYVGLTNYAVLHEATHNNLHSNPRCNYWLGLLSGLLFPVPFSLVHTTHQGHHL